MEIRIDPEDRLAPSPQKSNTPFLIALAVVLGILGVIGLNAYDSHSQRLAMEARLAEIDRELEAARQTEITKAKIAKAQRQKNEPAAQELQRLLNQPSKPQERQTVFNEKNYTPKGAINSIEPPAKRHFQKNKSQGILIEKNVGNWTWQSTGYGARGQRKIVSGQFTYLVKNGRVDTSSVCANEPYGTLRYRDCRKGAKQYFQRRCKAGSPEACSGADMIP